MTKNNEIKTKNNGFKLNPVLYGLQDALNVGIKGSAIIC